MNIIISLHIPKTAGTTFIETVKQVYEDKCVRLVGTPTLEDAYNQIKDNLYELKFIHGHIPYGIHKFMPEDVVCKYITFLRNPYERILSLYNFSLYTDPDTNGTLDYKHKPLHNYSLINFIRQYNVAGKDNNITRILSNSKKSFLDAYTYKDQVTNADYFKALKNLRSFYFIGLTETYEKSIFKLAKLLKWESIPMQEKIYYYPNRKKVSDLTDIEKLLLYKTQVYDNLIWEEAKKLNELFIRK